MLPATPQGELADVLRRVYALERRLGQEIPEPPAPTGGGGGGGAARFNISVTGSPISPTVSIEPFYAQTFDLDVEIKGPPNQQSIYMNDPGLYAASIPWVAFGPGSLGAWYELGIIAESRGVGYQRTYVPSGAVTAGQFGTGLPLTILLELYPARPATYTRVTFAKASSTDWSMNLDLHLVRIADSTTGRDLG